MLPARFRFFLSADGGFVRLRIVSPVPYEGTWDPRIRPKSQRASTVADPPRSRLTPMSRRVSLYPKGLTKPTISGYLTSPFRPSVGTTRNKESAMNSYLSLQLQLVVTTTSTEHNDARLRELEHHIRCAGPSGGCAPRPMLIRYYCPTYGQN